MSYFHFHGTAIVLTTTSFYKNAWLKAFAIFLCFISGNLYGCHILNKNSPELTLFSFSNYRKINEPSKIFTSFFLTSFRKYLAIKNYVFIWRKRITQTYQCLVAVVFFTVVIKLEVLRWKIILRCVHMSTRCSIKHIYYEIESH